jgi:pimeloyl-ACP methyl ester carboxylesterase
MDLLPAEFKHLALNTGEVTIGYSVGPDNGPDLLMLHGVTSRRDGFVRVLPALMPDYRIITIDQRGHGYSGHTPGRYSRGDHAADIRYVLEHVCRAPTLVWGHSMGGGNAVQMAYENNHGIAGLILEDAALFGSQRLQASVNSPIRVMFKAQLEMVEADLDEPTIAAKLKELNPGQPEFFGAWKAECLLQMDVQLLRNASSGASRPGAEPNEALTAIPCPMLILQADPDNGGILPDDYLAKIVPDRKDVAVVKLPGTNHNINREFPEPLLEVVLPWLRNLSAA